MWKQNKNIMIKSDPNELLQTLLEYRFKLVNIRRQLELSLLFRVVSRDEEEAKKTYKPKAREFKLRKYVGREDFGVYKILNNLEEAVQSILHKKGDKPPAPNADGTWERKDIKLDDPMDLSLEDAEIKMFEVDKILEEINSEIAALGAEEPSSGKQEEEDFLKKEDKAFLLQDVKGINSFAYADNEDRVFALKSCQKSLRAAGEYLRLCFCKEVCNKRKMAIHLQGEVEPSTDDDVDDVDDVDNTKEKDAEPKTVDPVEPCKVVLQKSLERPDIKSIPGMSYMREKCASVEEMRKRFDRILAKDKKKSEEESERKERRRILREKRRVEPEVPKVPTTPKELKRALNRSLSPYNLRMLICAQMISQAQKMMDLLEESKEKLKLSYKILTRCINKAKSTAETERKFITYLATN